MPEDATPEQPFQAVGTFVADAEGNITLVAIDGADIVEEEVGETMESPEMGESDEDMMMARAQKAGIV